MPQSDQQIALFVWSPRLRHILENCLRGIWGIEPQIINPDEPWARDIILSLPATCLFVVEAYNPSETGTYNPNGYRHAEGFRLALSHAEQKKSGKVLVIFRSLEAEFLLSPHFIDYATFFEFGRKINALTFQKENDLDVFLNLKSKTPLLTTLPRHTHKG